MVMNGNVPGHFPLVTKPFYIYSSALYHLLSDRSKKGHRKNFQGRHLDWKHKCRNEEATRQSKKPALSPFRVVMWWLQIELWKLPAFVYFTEKVESEWRVQKKSQWTTQNILTKGGNGECSRKSNQLCWLPLKKKKWGQRNGSGDWKEKLEMSGQRTIQKFYSLM